MPRKCRFVLVPQNQGLWLFPRHARLSTGALAQPRLDARPGPGSTPGNLPGSPGLAEGLRAHAAQRPQLPHSQQHGNLATITI